MNRNLLIENLAGNKLQNLLDRVHFLSFRTNWHRHYFLSKIMCFCGRHDYEIIGIVLHGDLESAHFQCFDCSHKKTSSCRQSNL